MPARGIQRATAAHRRKHFGEPVTAGLLDCPTNQCRLRRRAMLDHVDQRQCWLPLGKIVAQVLAGFCFLPRIIEHVVDQLEGSTDVGAIGRQRFFDLGTGVAEYRAQAPGCLEQLGRLVADHL